MSGSRLQDPDYWSWTKDANCASTDPEAFFAEQARYSPTQLRRVCNVCPVRQACLEHALRHEPEGWWGGMSPAERVRERARRGIQVKYIEVAAVYGLEAA